MSAPNPSGLSLAQRITARDLCIHAARLGVAHEPAIHYTQDSRRWQGIDEDRKAWRGEFPNYADCSAFVTWCLWNGLDHFHHADDVNGAAWRYGYTGTMLHHGVSVKNAPAGLVRCDAVIYGPGWPGEHTALYVGGGYVISHGSEPGPMLIPMRYRSDILDIRRYV